MAAKQADALAFHDVIGRLHRANESQAVEAKYSVIEYTPGIMRTFRSWAPAARTSLGKVGHDGGREIPSRDSAPCCFEGFEEKAREFVALAKAHLMERIADPAAAVRMALFLASPEAAFVTGSVLQIDGGIGVRLRDPV